MVRVFRRGLAVRFSEKRTCHFSGEVDVSFQKTEQKTECCPSRGTRNHRPFRKTDSGVRNGRCKDPANKMGAIHVVRRGADDLRRPAQLPGFTQHASVNHLAPDLAETGEKTDAVSENDCQSRSPDLIPDLISVSGDRRL